MPQTAAIISGIQRMVLYETRAVSLNTIFIITILFLRMSHLLSIISIMLKLIFLMQAG